jgi:hypothetical protein
MFGLGPVLRLFHLFRWKFKTLGLHPLAPQWRRAVIRLNELERRR